MHLIKDPDAELKATNDKLKENEKHIETLKMELAKWQDESNELNLKCSTYEAQLEQSQVEYRSQIVSKDVSFFSKEIIYIFFKLFLNI